MEHVQSANYVSKTNAIAEANVRSSLREQGPTLSRPGSTTYTGHMPPSMIAWHTISPITHSIIPRRSSVKTFLVQICHLDVRQLIVKSKLADEPLKLEPTSRDLSGVSNQPHFLWRREIKPTAALISRL